MRKAINALLTIGGLAAIGTAPAEAVGTRYPFCITGPEQPGLSNCTFTSYEQCQATASGRRLWCVENPYYARGGRRPARLWASRAFAASLPAAARLSHLLNGQRCYPANVN